MHRLQLLQHNCRSMTANSPFPIYSKNTPRHGALQHLCWPASPEISFAHRAAALTGLVRAQDVHARHLLDCRHARHDGALLGQLVGAQGKGHRQHGGHGDGDSSHDDHQHVGQRRAALCAATGAAVSGDPAWSVHAQGRSRGQLQPWQPCTSSLSDLQPCSWCRWARPSPPSWQSVAQHVCHTCKTPRDSTLPWHRGRCWSRGAHLLPACTCGGRRRTGRPAR